MDQEDTDYELLEAQSEIDRHHELILWLKSELAWCLGYISVIAKPGSETETKIFEIKRRLMQEVS